jgi:hypothetical protein
VTFPYPCRGCCDRLLCSFANMLPCPAVFLTLMLGSFIASQWYSAPMPDPPPPSPKTKCSWCFDSWKDLQSPTTCAPACLPSAARQSESACPSVQMSVCLSVCLSVRPSVRLPARLSACPSVQMSVCPSVLPVTHTRCSMMTRSATAGHICSWQLPLAKWLAEDAGAPTLTSRCS